MIPRRLKHGAGLVLALTALGFLATRLAFTPAPWPDGSAFYLPGINLFRWPPEWHMHNQAAFIPSYDQANFNIPIALPFYLGFLGHTGLMDLVHPALLIRIASVPALLAFAWLLWSWLIESLTPLLGARRAQIAASLVALAALWDPVIRWGTLVVRTETWIGLCWLWMLRAMHRREVRGDRPEEWSSLAWRLSAMIALTSYIHYEAVYLVPAIIVGLGFKEGWFKRLFDIGFRTTIFLIPWLIYVGLHAGLFMDQMEIQFHRLAHFNVWMRNPYMIFHSLFVDHGSPSGLPKFFNVAKGVFWLGLTGLFALSARVATQMSVLKPHRALLASTVAFVSCFYLWATKAEVWFVSLCHVAFWPWVGAALILACQSGMRPLGRRVIGGMSGTYAFLALASCFVQASAISKQFTWPVYEGWIDCMERAMGPRLTQPGLKVWQPHWPDVLVELSHRHPDWDLTRALDFEARRSLAIEAGKKMDVILYTRQFNAEAVDHDYTGPLRESDRLKMSHDEDLPFGTWALGDLQTQEPGRRTMTVCENGPFWAMVMVRKP